MRDVIRVERLPDVVGDPARSQASALDGTAIDAGSLAALGRVADQVLPSIVARLAVSGLGELEVRHHDWHIRVRRALVSGDPTPAAGSMAPEPASPGEPTQGSPNAGRSTSIATSPAVGYFVLRPQLAVGSRLAHGDVLGWVDVLGIRQDIVAPVDGLVGKLLVAPGDPIEYGQELVQLVPGGGSARSGQDGSDA